MDDSKEYCPFCGADLQGSPIPKEIQHHYGATHGVNYHFISAQNAHFFAHSFRKPSPLF